jgi:DNA mismatch repair ATPase MutL
MMQAQRNNGGGNHRTNNTTNTTRPTNNGNTKPNTSNNNTRPTNNGNTKPNNNNNNTRPTNNGNTKPNNNNNNTRPTNNGNTKPNNNNNGRPNGDNNGFNNGNTGKPNNGYPGKPGGNVHAPQPNTPAPNMHARVPRPVDRPGIRRGVPSFNAILGITFGSVINASINALLNSGYNVTTYDNSTVYMQNVAQFGITWPTVALYYGVNGLYSSQFEYVSTYQSQNVFNSAYSNICRTYGNPISQSIGRITSTATWWGGDANGYITLNFGSNYSNYGPQFYTTLTMGM